MSRMCKVCNFSQNLYARFSSCRDSEDSGLPTKVSAQKEGILRMKEQDKLYLQGTCFFCFLFLYACSFPLCNIKNRARLKGTHVAKRVYLKGKEPELKHS